MGAFERKIPSRYELEKRVGEGGMSEVWLAYDKLRRVKVAVKLVKPAIFERRPELGRRFLETSIALERVDHDGIVKVRDVGDGSDGTLPYLVLEWLEGRTLRDLLKNGEEVEKLLGVVESVIDSMAAAHAQGLIHRDLKPENVMVLKDGRSKVIDFDLAKWTSEEAARLTETSDGGFGTAAYAAPEQMEKAAGVDTRADVFSLGMMLNEALTGRTRRGTWVRALQPACSEELESLVMRCLSDEPDDRPRDAGELLEALRACRPYLREFAASPSVTDVGFKAPARTPPRLGQASTSAGAAGPVPTPARAARGAEEGKAGGSQGDATGAKAAPPSLLGRSMAARIAIPFGAIVIVGLGVGGYIASRTTGVVSDGQGRPGQSASLPGGPAAAPSAGGPAEAGRNIASASAIPPCPEGMVRIEGARDVTVRSVDVGNVDRLEAPPYSSSVDPFCIDTVEVTVSAYAECVSSRGCQAPSTGNQCNYGVPERDHDPVNCVDWERASRYCAQRGKRLPTEAEWFLAAGGRDSRRYPWGAGDPSDDRLQWSASCEDYYCNGNGTAPVGAHAAGSTPDGVQDLAGNVWEWVESSHQGLPPGRQRLRGGAWSLFLPEEVAATATMTAAADAVDAAFGFRCASSLPR